MGEIWCLIQHIHIPYICKSWANRDWVFWAVLGNFWGREPRLYGKITAFINLSAFSNYYLYSLLLGKKFLVLSCTDSESLSVLILWNLVLDTPAPQRTKKGQCPVEHFQGDFLSGPPPKMSPDCPPPKSPRIGRRTLS